jgi:fumarate hydratase subunit alpha/L(+)-tartrate dehydratase alpha subunit
MKLDLSAIEEAAKELYIRALKILPPDVKAGIETLASSETSPVAQRVLSTMKTNIRVAEDTENLLCQDTGIPIYNVGIGRNVEFDGYQLKEAIRRGCERATKEHPLRSSVVHPLTRKNNHTSCGIEVPVIHIDFSRESDRVTLEMVPKGSGSENNSFLKMAVPAEGIDAIKTCPPTIVGVGLGGTSDLSVALAKRAATRELGTRCNDTEGAALEKELSAAVNKLGIGPQGLGGDSTAFAVHIEIASTHITMNPIAVNMQCHSARRAKAVFSNEGITYGF